MPNNELHTPVDLARDLTNAVGGFDLDPASGCEPEPIATNRFTKDVDGLDHPWYGKTFVNPPYERFVIDEWADKIHHEGTRDGGPWLLVALVPARVNTDWWHAMADDADLVNLLNNRLRFGDYDGTGKYPYAIVVYGDDIPDALLDAIETANDALYEGASITQPVDVPRIRDVGVHTPIEIELDDRSIAFPESVPREATAYVESSRVRDDGLTEVLAIARVDGVDTYYLLHFDSRSPADVRCAAENVNTGGWREVPVVSIEAGPSTGHGNPFTYYA